MGEMIQEQVAPVELLEAHWEKSGLAVLISEAVERQNTQSDAAALVPIEPHIHDLARLHYLKRKRRAFTTLDFGVGYSTIAIAWAHHQNREDFRRVKTESPLRNSRLFEHHVVDADSNWIEYSRRFFPEHLKGYVTYHQSEVVVGTHLGQLCHYYDTLPNIIPDFIYLDGPARKDVKGKYRGLDFSMPERTVMAGDLLLMEPCFLPGTFIIVDGRTNNARILERNFRRSYTCTWDRDGDCTTFELDEERLGPHNILGSDLFEGRH